jgi:hypothetical protein
MDSIDFEEVDSMSDNADDLDVEKIAAELHERVVMLQSAGRNDLLLHALGVSTLEDLRY